MKHLERYGLSDIEHKVEANKKGLIFVHPKFGKVSDMYDDKFQVVGTYVDTLRQLFKGSVSADFLNRINESLELEDNTFRFLSHDWILGKSGRASGYQYRLQNNDLGLIVFFKMFHTKAEVSGSHLKIECSPWFLDQRTPQQVDKFLSKIASKVLKGGQPYYPAIHLAVDVQGWKPNNDLADKMLCKSRRVSNFNGYDTALFTVSEVACVYDRGQSYTFGSTSAVQLGIYNKTIESKKRDKFDYMEHKWKKGTKLDDGSYGYNSKSDVFRFEVRYHHSVIEQFALGTCDKKTGEIGVAMRTYSDVIKHLQALWQYGLKSFKLRHNSNYIAPIWTILQEDIVFKYPESSYKDNFHYKRYYKKATSFSGKNYQLFLGNFLSASARKRVKFKNVLKVLQGNYLWEDIVKYYEDKELEENALIERLRASYQQRILLGYGV